MTAHELAAPARFDADATAAQIWAAYTAGAALDALDPRPRTNEHGYAVQHAIEPLAGEAIGWKIAATSLEGQANIGVGEPFAGRLYRDRMRESGCEIPIDSVRLKVIEPEIAFVVGEDLPPGRATAPNALAAVVRAHAGIEVPDTRLVDHVSHGAPSLIADNGCSGLYVLGPEITGWPDVQLDRAPVAVTINGEDVDRGTGANVLGDPSVAFLWLVRHLSAHGRGLRAGDIVSTGTVTAVVPVKAGDTVVARFGEHSSASVTFT